MAEEERPNWHTAEYLLWLNNTEEPHFGAHALVHGMMRDERDDQAIGEEVLAKWPPHGFSASISARLVDAAYVGRSMREDHTDLGYGGGPRGDDYTLDVAEGTGVPAAGGAARCYSDHNEDIRVKGSCDYCGGVDRD